MINKHSYIFNSIDHSFKHLIGTLLYLYVYLITEAPTGD